MTMIRERELFIEWAECKNPHSDEVIALASSKVTALPGRVVVIMDPLRSTYGSLVIPETTGKRTRPDFGTVIASGVRGVNVGMRVIVRPYKGAWVEDLIDGHQVRFYGVGWSWEHCLIASVDEDGIHPFADWMLIDRPSNEVTDSGIYIALPGAKDQKDLVTVVSVGPWVRSINPGDKCYVASGPNDGVRIAFTNIDGNQFIKFVDEDGFKSVIAVLEE
jgi:co-chaperonin GroES (HSP10)